MSAVTNLKRGLSVLAALALFLSILAVPAFAKAPQGTAVIEAVDSFAPREVYAGAAQQAFTVRVRNPFLGQDGTLPATVDWVEIDPTSDFTISSAEGPGSWEPDIRSDAGRVIFTGDSLSPGSSATFTVTTSVARPGFDVLLPWKVSASDDGGASATAYRPEFEGALTPIIRVLQVVDNRFTGPDGIVDGDATAGQSADGLMTVANLGSANLTVSPEIVGENFTPTSTPSSTVLAPGGKTDLAWSGDFGEPEDPSRVIAKATASSDDPFAPAKPHHAKAPVWGRTELIDIVSAVDLVYEEESIAPTIVVPGSTASFSLTLENLGEAGLADIDLANSTLSFDAFSASLGSPTELAGESSGQFAFAETTVPTSVADGDYAPTVTIDGTDSNGADVTRSIDLEELVTVDSTVPVIDIEADLPTAAVAGENDAATSDTAFDVTGTVTDADANGEQQPCGECTVNGELLVFDESGTLIQSEAVEFDNDDGDLSATVNTVFDAAATAARVSVDAVDLAGLEGSGDTGLFEVDVIAPEPGEARTGGPEGRDFTRIDIFLHERVAFPDLLTPASFEVDGNVVHSVTLADSENLDNNNPDEQGNSYRIGDRIILDLAQELGEDETPAVRFRAGGLDRPFDRVELGLANFTLTPLDFIVPAEPAIDEIGGLGELNGQFFTNDPTPDVVISDVTQGHTVQVYEDTNDNDIIDEGTDRKLAETEVLSDSGSTTVTLEDLGQNEGDVTLLSRALDGSDNEGATAVDELTLDFTAPTFSSLSVDVENRTVQVTTSEALRRGRNAVADWVVETLKFGRYVALERDSVTGDNNTNTRTIHISDSEENWGEGAVDRLTFDFSGDESTRYIDRAGNPLANFQHTN